MSKDVPDGIGDRRTPQKAAATFAREYQALHTDESDGNLNPSYYALQ